MTLVLAVTLKVRVTDVAAEKLAFPACAAVMEQIPTESSVTLTPDTVQIGAELLEKLGLKAQLGSRIEVVNSGSAIMSTVAERGPGAIGMGQISEIRVMIAKGCAVKFVAPLPDAIQNISTYYAAAMAASSDADAAAALTRALTSADAKMVFAATGID